MAQIQSAARVVKTIDFLAKNGRAKLDDLASELGVHKSSALRLLGTLRELDWIVSASRDYMLGPQLVAVGQAAAASIDLQESLGLAEGLRDETGESVHVGVPLGNQMLIVARVDSHHAHRVSCDLGSQDPMHTSSLGKAYLASLPDGELDVLLNSLALEAVTPNSITSVDELRSEIAATRQRGYSIDNEEGRLGVACMGFALKVGGERQTMSLSITGPASRWNQRIMEAKADELKALVRSRAPIAFE